MSGQASPRETRGGDIERHERFAETGVAGQERELADGDATGPEPFELFACDLVESGENRFLLRERLAHLDMRWGPPAYDSTWA